MSRKTINVICRVVPLFLSWTACIWVLGNVAGGVRGTGEGLGFHIFWLLILAQAPFILGYLLTAEWRRGRAAMGFLLQTAALILAFAPVAFFRL
ncbi:MAG: hypothetical protein H0U98_05660 [Alphaproteobacteria bacterium]|nr:hypothetical protein [Alphaproteobacteria bacterium]